MKTKLTGAVAVLASAALLATGCGGQGKDDAAAPAKATSAAPATNGVEALEAAQILDKSKAALKSATSFHTKGEMMSEGSKIGLDLKNAGENVKADVSMNGAKVELLQVAGRRYMRPDAKFWVMFGGGQAQGAEIAKLVGDRWVQAKATDKSTAGLFEIADVDSLLDTGGTLTKGAAKDFEGKPAIALVDKSDEGGTLYVATTGEPYPLKLEAPNPADGGLTFSEFGATFADLNAPAAADVLDLDKLLKKS